MTSEAVFGTEQAPNQSPPFVDRNLFLEDRALQDACGRRRRRRRRRGARRISVRLAAAPRRWSSGVSPMNFRRACASSTRAETGSIRWSFIPPITR